MQDQTLKLLCTAGTSPPIVLQHRFFPYSEEALCLFPPQDHGHRLVGADSHPGRFTLFLRTAPGKARDQDLTNLTESYLLQKIEATATGPINTLAATRNIASQ